MEIEDYRVVDGKTHQHSDQVVLSGNEDNGDNDDNHMLSRDKRKNHIFGWKLFHLRLPSCAMLNQ